MNEGVRRSEAKAAPLGKRLHLASNSSNSPNLLEIFFIFAVNSPWRRFPLGKRLHLASDSSNSPDLLEIFFIFAVNSPKAEAAPWGKDSISLRIPPTVLTVRDYLYLSRQFPQGGGRPLGKRLHLASDSSNSPDRWRSFISSPSIPPRRRPPPGEKTPSRFGFLQQS